jgi:hypothetical protein
MEIPMICTLTEAELSDRRRTVLDSIRDEVIDVAELPNGYMYRFQQDPETLMRLSRLIELERQCCRFLTFEIIAEPIDEPVRLKITGPPGARVLIADFFG